MSLKQVLTAGLWPFPTVTSRINEAHHNMAHLVMLLLHDGHLSVFSDSNSEVHRLNVVSVVRVVRLTPILSPPTLRNIVL